MRDLAREDWTPIRALFDELVDLDEAERSRRLDRAGLPAHLIATTRALLRSATGRGILDEGNLALLPIAAPASYNSLASGSEVGAFTIDRLIGRGGMGEVYLAHRTAKDFDQRVALKMLRAEAAERGELFERERRLLARLEHPGIARLIDGGIAPDGRPYMAMEYVDGEPIDLWCRRTSADLKTRLRLFREICEAVAYAHAGLVVHCDLKPSNILIDSAGKVRLLDFGIARLLEEGEAVPAVTRAMLTPAYAAPEQLDSEPSTVATDVYSLGVVLFELVAGTGPWQRDGSSAPALMRRMLYEDPPLPSQVAKRLGAPVPSRWIAGDIDAIVLKAMRRIPAARYRGAGELADDIERHLEMRPVFARAGTARYMIGRFARRYRWAVAASASAIVALLVGAGGIAWQARQTAIERDVALAEVRRSDATRRMVTLVFRNARDQPDGGDASVKEMLNDASRRLIASMDRSAESAALINAIADLYIQVDDQVGAETLLDAALANRVGEGNPEVQAGMRLKLASIKAVTGKPAESERLLALAEPFFTKNRERFRAEILDIVLVRAALTRLSGDPATGARLILQSLPEAEIVFAENYRELLRRYNSATILLLDAFQLDSLPAIFARTEAVLKRTGQERSVEALNLLQQRGVYYFKRGDIARSEAVLQQAVALRRERFGPSAGLAITLTGVGRARLALGRPADARPLLAEARGLAVKYLGIRDRRTINTEILLSEALAETGDVPGAARLLASIEPLAQPFRGRPDYGIFLRVRAIVRWHQGRRAEAEADLHAAETIFRASGREGAFNLTLLAPMRARIASRT